MDLKIISAAHEGCRDIHGYMVVSGEGLSFRAHGWASTMRLAKRLRAAIKRDPSAYGEDA